MGTIIVQRRRIAGLTALTVFLLVHTSAICLAEPSWIRRLSFKRVEADPSETYELTESHGPWMILAAAFAGEGARTDAHELVLELRDSFDLPAYIHRKNYDFKDSVEGLGLDPYGNPRRMKYRNSIAYDEYAVLVGDFETINDPAIGKALKKLKHCHPECLSSKNGRHPSLRFYGLRTMQKKINGDPSKSNKGPLGSAFKTRNPILPREYFVSGGINPMVLEMNKGVKHSLLTCPGKYSVRVATFRGNVVLDQSRIQRIASNNERMESRLAQAAEKAHSLAVALRQRGVQAYEFHDRHESIVTIGSFDSVGTPRQDGPTEINPSIWRIMTAYGPEKKKLPGSAQATGVMPRSLGGVSFDIQPTPVEVPRKSAANTIAQSKRR